ncbi:MAG: IPExxxVDY family protein [Flavobacteriaceae bacterium]|nr:IPExxxVDY family protein [Flavobacteriaceae bacterium]
MELDDFGECETFILIAVHSTLEDYRLAYILNKKFNLKLKRITEDLDVAEANYSCFEWNDFNLMNTWTLFSNICKIEKKTNKITESLFSNKEHIVRIYNLIPEHKTTNYFLKISNQEGSIDEQEIIDQLGSVPNIILAYKVETENLKSKSNLIIN